MDALRLSAAIGAVLVTVGCQDLRTGAALSVGSRSLDGSIGIGASSVAGKNSVESLGLDGATSNLDARVDLTFEAKGRMHLALKGFQSSHDGSGVLDEEFAKGPIVMPAGTPVDSDFDVGLYTAAWTFDLAERDDLEAGLGFGLAWLDLKAGFVSQSNGDEIFTDESAPIPLLAGRLIWGGERFTLGLEASGIDVSYAGDHAAFLDLDVCTRWRFLGKRFGQNGELLLGWRYAYAAIDYDDDVEAVDAGLSLSGPYFGIGFQF